MKTLNPNITVIIIAAGEASRWKNYLEVPKHLIPIDNEPILYRTVRLLKERHIKDIFIVGPPNDDRYNVTGTCLYVPDKNPKNHDADKFLNSENLWNKNGRTIVLYGDVYFTDNAIDTIVNHTNIEWCLFCRFNPSKITGAKSGECFAQSFYPHDLKEHKEKLLYIASLKEKKIISRCGGWEHYRAMNGLRNKLVKSPHKKYKKYIEINDWTDDFDTPEDYDVFIKKWEDK